MEGGLSTDALIAEVLVSKYADRLPLYRQAQIYARQGVNLDYRRWLTGSGGYPQTLIDLYRGRVRCRIIGE